MRNPRRRSPRLAGALALALLLAQWLALAHGVLHAGGGAARPVVSTAAKTDAPGWASLFGQHDGSDGPAQCRLIDQLAGGVLVAPAAPQCAALPPAQLQALPPVTARQGRPALNFRARAPPVQA